MPSLLGIDSKIQRTVGSQGTMEPLKVIWLSPLLDRGGNWAHKGDGYTQGLKAQGHTAEALEPTSQTY